MSVHNWKCLCFPFLFNSCMFRLFGCMKCNDSCFDLTYGKVDFFFGIRSCKQEEILSLPPSSSSSQFLRGEKQLIKRNVRNNRAQVFSPQHIFHLSLSQCLTIRICSAFYKKKLCLWVFLKAIDFALKRVMFPVLIWFHVILLRWVPHTANHFKVIFLLLRDSNTSNAFVTCFKQKHIVHVWIDTVVNNELFQFIKQ